MTAALKAAEAYRALGWQLDEHAGQLELATGTVVDALEVPREAGILAARWWLYTDGAPDDIRALPSLPCPGEAMAVIAAGNCRFFLAQAGSCPWTSEDPVTTRASDRAVLPAIRWHSHASRIPFPPGRTGDGQETAWAHLPARGLKLPCPAVLLHLLAAATAARQRGPGMLALPGNVLAIPVLGDTPAAPPQPTPPHTRPAIPFGF